MPLVNDFSQKPFVPNYRISGTCVLRKEGGKKQCLSDFAARGIHLTSLLKCTAGILASSQITLKPLGHGHALEARSWYNLKHGKFDGRKFLPSCICLPLNPLATTHFWESMSDFSFLEGFPGWGWKRTCLLQHKWKYWATRLSSFSTLEPFQRL